MLMQRDARQREQHSRALHRAQPLVQDQVGERDGDDREQPAEHGGEAQQPAGGGDRERGVGAGVEQADHRQLGDRAPGDARGGRSGDDDQDRDGDGARGGDAGERVVLGGAVEEDEREADAERGDQRELEGLARIRGVLVAGLERRQRDAGERGDDPDPLQRLGTLAVEDAGEHGDDRARGHDRRDDAHRPDRERAVEAEHGDRAEQADEDAGGDGVGVGAADQQDQRERDQPDRLADERDHRGRVHAARAAGEEVRDAPHQRREERRADHVLAAAAAAR